MTTKTSKHRYALHVEQLASAFEVVVEYDSQLKYEDATGKRVFFKHKFTGKIIPVNIIHVRPIFDDTTYATALHELGHNLHPMGHLHWEAGSAELRKTGKPATMRDIKLQWEAECAAWEWAEHHALEWTAGMESVKRYGLGTYQRNYYLIFGRYPPR